MAGGKALFTEKRKKVQEIFIPSSDLAHFLESEDHSTADCSTCLFNVERILNPFVSKTFKSSDYYLLFCQKVLQEILKVVSDHQDSVTVPENKTVCQPPLPVSTESNQFDTNISQVN